MKVLVAIDKSEESQMALQYACHMLEHFDARVDALHVKPGEAELGPETLYMPFVGKEGMKEWVEAEAEAVEEQVLSSCVVCRNGQVPCKPRIVAGDPADEILHIAHTERYDMIVLGSHGRSSLRGFLLGTVHSKILHHARQPVLIVRNFRPIRRVLVAYRGSQCDQGALEFTAMLLHEKKPEITVLHVQETERGESEESARACLLKGENTLKDLDHVPVTKMVKGNFVDGILKEVATERFDLIVLGAYGHRRPRYLKVISDEALDIARLTTRPVLVYRDDTDQGERPGVREN